MLEKLKTKLEEIRLKLEELKPKFKLACQKLSAIAAALTALTGFKISGAVILIIALYLNKDELKQVISDLKK